MNSRDIVDALVSGSYASEIHDMIKDSLYSRSAEMVDEIRPHLAYELFNGEANEEEGFEE